MANPANEDNELQGNMNIKISLPKFWNENPSLWFIQCEAQFALANIRSEKVKFHYVVVNLDFNSVSEVSDIISNPPLINPYTALKNALIYRFSPSENQKIRSLLNYEDIGEKKPSQLLREIKKLGENIPENLIKILWTDKLPNLTQSILAGQNLNLEELAMLADKIQETPTVSSSCMKINDNSNNEIKNIKDQIEKLSNSFNSFKENFFNKTDSKPRFKNFKPPTSSTSPYCWYHQNFGIKAKKCVRPCSFKGNLLNEH